MRSTDHSEYGGTPDLRVLLFSPLAGRDPLSGDTSYTQALLADPPPGVRFVTYAEALADGSLRELGRRPRRGQPFEPLVFLVRLVELTLRRLGVMFREPVWWVRIEPGRYDLVHLHLFVVKQVGPVTPVLSSAGYPLTVLYRERDRWGALHVRVALVLERCYARAVDSHVPWLRSQSRRARMTVYSEASRSWLIERGVDPTRVTLMGTFLDDAPSEDRSRERRRSLTFIGRALQAKGGLVALEAFRLLHAADPSWTMTFVTSSESAKNLPLVDGVEVLVDVDRATILDKVLPQTDVLVAPSNSDCGVPYALLEAVRSGACVVTSDLRWLDDRLSGPGVRRVPRTATAVARAVRELTDGGVVESEGARALFERYFSAEVFYRDQLLPSYRQTISE